MRYVLESIQKDLRKKLVFLAGPRQVGKSTLAKSLIQNPSNYLNWDIQKDRQIILKQTWTKDNGLVVLDELHKFKSWKNFLKGVIDEFQNSTPLLVTGSARLETFRKGGDALTGRTYLHRLHPIDPIEAVKQFGISDYLSASKKLIKSGGFPEAFFNPDEANRLREDRLQIVIREDIRDVSTVSDIRGMEILIDLLRERVGGSINYSNLSSDIGVSPPTIKKWITILEKLYVIFIITPYARNLSRSIRREPKAYFYDCSAATNGEGAIFENLVAATLLKWIQYSNDTKGTRFNLQYFRDKDNHEVDFVVSEGTKAKVLIEAKLSEDSLSGSLVYLSKALAPIKSFQIVGKSLKTQQKKQATILSIEEIQTVIEALGLKI